MKRFGFPIAGLCIAFCLADSCLQAQPANRGGQGQQGRGQRGGGRAQGGQGIGGPKGAGRNEQQTPPLLRVFDTNGDGELTENEIENAASALKKLDTDRNGRLSAEELQPTGSNGQSGSGGQRGAAGRGGQQPQGRGEAKGGPGARSGSPSGRGGQLGGGGGRGGDPARGDAAFAAQLAELDSNNDGNLNPAELPEHMHGAFNIADADRNGSLDDKEQLVLAQQFRRDRLPPPAEQGLERKNQPTQGRPQGNRQ